MATVLQRPSPSGSPALRPMPFSISSASPSSPLLLTPSSSPRSYARAPQQRPYALSPRSSQRLEPIDGDSKAFAELVVGMIEDRARRIRSGAKTTGESTDPRKGRSLGGSLSGSWENERAELIVDIPVWAPGCFQDLSTLHALRDTTLSHTHSLLAYFMAVHQIPASYRLLPRSATSFTGPPAKAGGRTEGNGKPNCRHQVGWGCIRLAPSVCSPILAKADLKPAHRRTSSVLLRRPSVSRPSRRYSRESQGGDEIPPFRLDLDSAIVESDDEEDVQVELKEGYRSRGSDDECEEECADVLVAEEIEKRGAKEGQAFLMTLFGSPALILC